MQTAISISIPNPIFEAAEQLARKLCLSLDELYSTALTTYLNAHRDSEVTAALDRVYETEASAISPVLVKMQVVSVGEG